MVSNIDDSIFERGDYRVRLMKEGEEEQVSGLVTSSLDTFLRKCCGHDLVEAIMPLYNSGEKIKALAKENFDVLVTEKFKGGYSGVLHAAIAIGGKLGNEIKMWYMTPERDIASFRSAILAWQGGMDYVKNKSVNPNLSEEGREYVWGKLIPTSASLIQRVGGIIIGCDKAHEGAADVPYSMGVKSFYPNRDFTVQGRGKEAIVVPLRYAA